MSFYKSTWVIVKVLTPTVMGLLAGCAGPTTPLLDASFGQAVRATRQAQTRQPTPPAPALSGQGMDGKAAVNIIERYQDSFKTPPKTFEVINPGGAGSGP
jgi:hypothetical protein